MTTKTALEIKDWVGAIKYLISLGSAGIFAAYLLMVTLPETRKEFNETSEKQANMFSEALSKRDTDSRDDRREARSHGDMAMKSVDSLRSVMEGMHKTLQENHSEHKSNQELIIQQNKKKIELDEQILKNTMSTKVTSAGQ